MLQRNTYGKIWNHYNNNNNLQDISLCQHCDFTIYLLFTWYTTDTANPTIMCPGNQVSRNPVSWTDPTASDLIDTAVRVVCVPSSGSTFTDPVTPVTCTATDDAMNSAMCSFSVTLGMCLVFRLCYLMFSIFMASTGERKKQKQSITYCSIFKFFHLSVLYIIQFQT